MRIDIILKHFFIPHEKNNYKPHIFRELSVATLLFGSVFLLGASAGSSFLIHKTVEGASIAASVLIDLTNDDRIASNEEPLVKSEKLNQAATLKGKDMASKGYFAHNSPEGVTPWYWFKEVGYDFLYAGENLAINFTESRDVENAWLNSPAHRANLLNVKFHEIGIATVEGTYNNNPTIFVVQMFGTPASAQTVPVPSVSTTTEKVLETNQVKEKSTSTELATLTGEVKGEENISNALVPVLSTDSLEIVKNTNGIELKIINGTPVEKYSTWYGRLLFGGSHYVDIIYKILIFIIAIALVTSILVEVRRQHPKHILYGIALLLILTTFVYINRGFF